MERFVPLCRLNVVLALAMAMVMGAPAYAQITTPCNASVINNSLGPCMGFLTNSSGNGTSPTAECCSSIKSLTSGGMDCLCLIVTATIPFRIPINRTLAISLPRACKLPGVPLQCKGPASLGPSPSPVSAPSLSPQASPVLPSPVTPSLSPQPAETTPPPVPTPSSTPSVDSGTPSATTGSGRSNLTPSSAASSYSLLPSVVLIVFGFAVYKHY